MANKPKVSYKRAPLEELLKLLMPGGHLSWLVNLEKKPIAGYQHNVHFRSGDEVHIYRGGTMVFSIRRLKSGGIKVPGKIDDVYKKQLRKFGLCHTWDAGDVALQETVMRYLDVVKVSKKWIQKEGLIQIQWSQATIPWTPIDREAAFENDPKRNFYEVEAAFGRLMAIYDAQRLKPRSYWWKMPEKPKRGGGLDQLAVDGKGRLVLLELKDALGSSSGAPKVYYSPLQLLQYAWEWHDVLQGVRGDLQKIIDARRAVGLSMPDGPPLNGGIRAAIGFGPFFSNTDKKSERGYKYKRVLDIVNCHLPSGVPCIETWYWEENNPCKHEW